MSDTLQSKYEKVVRLRGTLDSTMEAVQLAETEYDQTAHREISELRLERDQLANRVAELEGRVQPAPSPKRVRVELPATLILDKSDTLKNTDVFYRDTPAAYDAIIELRGTGNVVENVTLDTDRPAGPDKNGISGIYGRNGRKPKIHGVTGVAGELENFIHGEGGLIEPEILECKCEATAGYGVGLWGMVSPRIIRCVLGNSTREHVIRGAVNDVYLEECILENLDLRETDPYDYAKSTIWGMEGRKWRSVRNTYRGGGNVGPLDRGRDFGFVEGGECDWRLGGKALEQFKRKAATYQLHDVEMVGDRFEGAHSLFRIKHRTHGVRIVDMYTEGGIEIEDGDVNADTAHLYDDPASDIAFEGTLTYRVTARDVAYGLYIKPRVKRWSVEHLLVDIADPNWRAPAYSNGAFVVHGGLDGFGRITFKGPKSALRDDRGIAYLNGTDWNANLLRIADLKRLMPGRVEVVAA